MKEYYDRRAPEYDDWYLGTGAFADVEWPGFADELAELEGTIAALAPARTLDVACGTGFLTRHLRGEIVGLDHSERMLEIARSRVPNANFIVGDALALPFPDGSFDRVFTGHFYGHLDDGERLRFLAEARRLAPELVVVDAGMWDDVVPVAVEERVLKDGSRWEVLKRYFTPEALVGELGGGDVLFAGRWFVAAQAKLAPATRHGD